MTGKLCPNNKYRPYIVDKEGGTGTDLEHCRVPAAAKDDYVSSLKDTTLQHYTTHDIQYDTEFLLLPLLIFVFTGLSLVTGEESVMLVIITST